MKKVMLLLLAASFSSDLLAQNSERAGETTRSSLCVAAGASIPVGNFGDASRGGAARLGAALAAEFSIGGSTAWISSVYASYNPSHPNASLFLSQGSSVTADPWWSLWPMTGIAWRLDASPDISVECSGQLGLFAGISPALRVYNPTFGEASISSDRALAVSAGAGVGVTLADRYALRIRYLHANPGYDRTFTDLGVSVVKRDYQLTSLFLITLGWTR